MNEHEKPQIDFMHKLARQIVERRNLVFLFVILAAIFTVFSVRWVKVETDMTTYLPKTSETRMGLDIMDEQFTTYGSADVMVANITPAEADELSDRLAELKGVQMLDYDDTRPSLQSLYGTQAGYVAAVTSAANALVAERVLLPRDAQRAIDAAVANPVLP